jgi:hypothetical protein
LIFVNIFDLVGSKESAYVYAIVSGGGSLNVAKECAKGTIPGWLALKNIIIYLSQDKMLYNID